MIRPIINVLNVKGSDISIHNLMLDATQLCPDGFHPVAYMCPPNYKGYAKCITRTECWPRYYLIDFGFARQYPPGDLPREMSLPCASPSRQAVPELRSAESQAYNPFPIDIFALGLILKWKFSVVSNDIVQFIV